MSSPTRSPRQRNRRAADGEVQTSTRSPRSRRIAARVEADEPAPVVEAAKPKDPTHSDKMHTLMVRSVTGIIMIIAFLLIISTGHKVVAAFVILLQIMVYREVTMLRYSEAKEKDIPFFRSLNWLFLFSTLYWVYGKQLWIFFQDYVPEALLEYVVHRHVWNGFVLYITGFLLFVLSLRKETVKYQFGQLTWMIMTLMNVVIQSSVISVNIHNGLFWFMLPHSLIICNDIMAYFVGIAIGKKFIQSPLTRLSPNKTWEGFIGSLLFTVVFGFFFSRVLGTFDWIRCSANELALSSTCAASPLFTPQALQSYLPALQLPAFLGDLTVTPIQLHTVVFALFASIIAPFGGFFASAMKRAFQKKDFDQIIPGHGGVTDRMDCQFLIGLFIYVYYVTFIKTSITDVDSILAAVTALPLVDQQAILKALQATVGGAHNVTPHA